MSDEPLDCPIESILRRLSGPWTLHILWLLQTHGVLRYGELKKQLQAISPKMLAERLKRLEADGLVQRDYTPTIPPAVHYSLTRRGVELKEMLNALSDVAMRWRQEDIKAGADQKPGAANALRQASSATGRNKPLASSSANKRPSLIAK